MHITTENEISYIADTTIEILADESKINITIDRRDTVIADVVDSLDDTQLLDDYNGNIDDIIEDVAIEMTTLLSDVDVEYFQ